MFTLCTQLSPVDVCSGNAKNFYLGVIAEGVQGMEVPSGVQGQCPSRWSMGGSLQKLQQFADIVYISLMYWKPLMKTNGIK